MILYQRPIIVRQAVVPIAVLTILALIVHYTLGWMLAVWVWLLIFLVAFLFRDPRREIPPIPLAIVSPIDGKVIAINEVHDPYCNRPAMQIVLQSTLGSVFTIRSPMEGKVHQQWFGTLPDTSDEGIYAAAHIPAFAQWVQSDEGDDVVTALTPRIGKNGARCHVSSGERIGQGQRCAFIPFGVNAETFISLKSRIDVKAGDYVKAGTSVLATIIR